MYEDTLLYYFHKLNAYFFGHGHLYTGDLGFLVVAFFRPLDYPNGNQENDSVGNTRRTNHVTSD